MMSEERYKLHPISAVMNFIKGLKDLIFPFVVVFVANGFQGGPGENEDWTRFIPYILGFGFLVLILISGIVKWKRFVYWFEDNELRIEYGLFVKMKRYIPFERIQSLNYTESILHRPLKLVKVKIETAGSGNPDEAEAELTAITKEAASRIEKELVEAKKRKQSRVDINDLEEQSFSEKETVSIVPVFKMKQKDLLILATTSGGIGVVFSGLAVFMLQFSELIPYEKIYEEMMVFLKFGFFLVAISVFFVLVLAWIVSVILTTLNYFEFTIWKDDDQIIITRGLLEKKKVSIPIARVQGIRIVENPLRQLFGYCTVFVESAGGSLSDKDQKIRLFPFIKKEKLNHYLVNLFPDLHVESEWTVSPEKAKPFYYRLDFIWMIPVIVGVGYFYFPYGLLSLLLIPVLILFGLWQHRSAGYSIKGNQLSMRYRGFSKYTFMIEKKRMQSVEMKQSPFQKKHLLASFETTIKSGLLGATAKVEHLELKDVEEVMNWFTPSEKS